jgi:hypothetical protein
MKKEQKEAKVSKRIKSCQASTVNAYRMQTKISLLSDINIQN